MLRSGTAIWLQLDKVFYQEIQNSFHCRTSSAVKLQIPTTSRDLGPSAFFLKVPFRSEVLGASSEHIANTLGYSAEESHPLVL